MNQFLPARPPVGLPTPTLSLFLTPEGRQSLPIADLLYLQSEANYTWLIWRNGRRVLMARTIKHFESLLPAGWFVRLHRNCLANKAHITKLERTEGSLEARLDNGVVIPISRRRQATVRRNITNPSYPSTSV